MCTFCYVMTQKVSIMCCSFCFNHLKKEKGKGRGFISAFIEVPYTQGAQVRITQC